ncbi:hypothetical protein XHV734_4143 [Xanthomonas hortorum pv. vitians]|nr:hypothetical protein XHV734_4143 [Xanthomonas hortorum pv. vitians]
MRRARATSQAAAQQARSDAAHSSGPICRLPNPQSPIPNPQSPIPNPQSPIPNPQSPIPNPQSPIPNPQSPIPALEPYRTVWYVRDVLPRTTDAWQLPLGHSGLALRGREQHEQALDREHRRTGVAGGIGVGSGGRFQQDLRTYSRLGWRPDGRAGAGAARAG